jgi:hypothetical protein
MKQLNLHGVEVYIATPHEIEKAGANPVEWHRLDASGALLLQPHQRRDALIAAMYDLSRVDFALPHAWVDENCKRRDTFRLEDWLWDCSNSSTFGEPLYVGGWKRLISLQVLALLVEG